MTPPALQELLDQIDACEREACTLAGDLTDQQINWQPRAGEAWSIGQCLDHLRVMNLFYLRDFGPLVDEARRQRRGPFTDLSPGWFARRFIAFLEPPPRMRTKAPAQGVPASTVRRDEVLSGFVSSHDPYRALVHAAAEVDVNRVTGPNPFFRWVPMSVAAALLIIPAHDRRHLWQASEVRQDARFPAA
jgi:hypothetical protein